MPASYYVDNSQPCTTIVPSRNVGPLGFPVNTNDRELPIEIPNYPAEAKVETYEHQLDVPRDAFPDRGTPAIAASSALRMTTFVVLADEFTLANIFISMEAAFAHHNQTLAGSPRAAQPHARHYHCATQRRSNARLRVGTDGFIPRWTRGSTIKYIVRAESFPEPNMATYTVGKLAEAISMWKDKGVRFQLVYRTCEATFQVVYRDRRADDPNAYAEAFFPNDHLPADRTLTVYGPALKEDNRDYLANIFAHEIGHIMGLRHEFAAKEETESVLWGKVNDSSIMNYFDHLSKWRVQKQDLDDLESFYEFTGRKHEGLVIREFEPPTFSYQ